MTPYSLSIERRFRQGISRGRRCIYHATTSLNVHICMISHQDIWHNPGRCRPQQLPGQLLPTQFSESQVAFCSCSPLSNQQISGDTVCEAGLANWIRHVRLCHSLIHAWTRLNKRPIAAWTSMLAMAMSSGGYFPWHCSFAKTEIEGHPDDTNVAMVYPSCIVWIVWTPRKMATTPWPACQKEARRVRTST